LIFIHVNGVNSYVDFIYHVLLFNGAPKTSGSAQEGETSMAFHEANVFAERILKALSENALKLCPNDRTILNDLDSSEITDILL
jgi:hypothetical protein